MMKYYKHRQQITMEVKDVKQAQFDFSSLLQTVIARITSYTQICLISLTPQLIHFKVTWMLVHRHKNYRIICSPKQSAGYLASIRKVIHLFPIRKAYLPLAFLSTQKKQNQMLFWEQFQTLLFSTAFDQIFIESLSWFAEQRVNTVFASLSAVKISLNEKVQFQRANSLIEYIHKIFLQRDVNLSMRVSNLNDQQLLKFISVWRETLTNKPTIVQKQFGSSFPKDNANMEAVNQKRQHISIFFDERQVLRVTHMRDFGYGLTLKGKLSEQLLINVIRLISESKQSVSLQVQPLDGTTLLHVVAYVVENMRQSKYHISIGHQVELTTYRLVLNTTGLSLSQVNAIFQLMKQPGHYELICYSSAEHFPAAVELFRVKPLVKFNFFLPLEEFRGERQELIGKMQKHAQKLLLKVYSYAGLCRKMGEAGYLQVNTIFYALVE